MVMEYDDVWLISVKDFNFNSKLSEKNIELKRKEYFPTRRSIFLKLSHLYEIK